MHSGGAQGLPVPNCQCGRWGCPLLKQQQRPPHWAGDWQPVRVAPNLVTRNKPSATGGPRGAGVAGAARDGMRTLVPGRGGRGPYLSEHSQATPRTPESSALGRAGLLGSFPLPSGATEHTLGEAGAALGLLSLATGPLPSLGFPLHKRITNGPYF